MRSQQGYFKQFSALKHMLSQRRRAITAVSTSLLIVFSLSWMGILQSSELLVLDNFFRLRSIEPSDPAIVLVTIDEDDIAQVGAWPIPDATLAKVLQTLNAQKPRVIGLDIYRDLPVHPGHELLVQVFKSSPHIIGAQKRFGLQQIPPPPVLANLDQVGFVDLIIDEDGKVRRDLISARDKEGKPLLSLGTILALKYLEKEGIYPQEIAGFSNEYHLGKLRLSAFRSGNGGYAKVDDNGYQVLLNYRGFQERFHTISLRTILQGKLPPNAVRDRIVLIGSTAESTNDFFITPYDGSKLTEFVRTPGVFIHANSASQLVNGALHGRSLIQTLPEWAEALWILVWCLVTVIAVQYTLRTRWLGKKLSYVFVLISVVSIAGLLSVVSFGFFLISWWIPIVGSLIGVGITLLICLLLHGHDLQKLAYFDGLTQVANRRFFDQQLYEFTKSKGQFSLILCDVDCFKSYNDTYGHQAGDVCLKKIATTIRRAVRRSDVVARYGGEEFAIILPSTDRELALQTAERVVYQVRLLKIPHINSVAANYVTISCGVVTLDGCDVYRLPKASLSDYVLAKADDALYLSKKEGRDRVTCAS
jgi:adenylate cyclase